MLDHEIALAERYRRFVTVLMIQPSCKRKDFQERLKGHVRRGDLVFGVGDSALAVLMSETDQNGARVALSRYVRECAAGVTIAYGIGSYPEDGTGAMQLLTAASRNLNEWARMRMNGAPMSETQTGATPLAAPIGAIAPASLTGPNRPAPPTGSTGSPPPTGAASPASSEGERAV